MLLTKWTAQSIESVCLKVTSGGTPSRSNPSFFKDGTIPWIKTGELNGWYVDEIEESITEAAVANSSAKIFPPETVLLAMYGDGRTMGSTGLLRKPAATNQACCAMLADESKVIPKFLLYSLQYYKPALLKLAVSGAQRNLSGKTIKGFQIGIPEMPVQRRIAVILSAYDDLVEKNTRRIAILEEMARRIYEEWFISFRFPGYEAVRMAESELGLVPEGWVNAPLRTVANVNARSVKRGKEPTEVFYVDIASVSTGSIDEKHSYLYEDAPGRARRLVADGDIIWSCVRPNRRSYALVQNPEDNMIVSTGFAVISPVKVPFSYLYQAVTTDTFVGYLVNSATGAAYPAVSAGDFEAAMLTIPPPDLLQKFHEVVEPMMRLAETLRDKNANLRQTRSLLLPRLISGELDVSMLPMPEEACA